MLQAIRERVSGWFAAVFFIMLIIPFAFWGINYYFGAGNEPVAATVDGKPITLQEYQRTLQTLRQQYGSMLKDMPAAEQESLLRKRSIEGLVQRGVLQEENHELRLQVSDKMVRQTIEGIAAFQGADGFDPGIYQSSIAAAGYTPVRFEKQVREDMKIGQLQAAVMASAFVLGSETENVSRLENETRDFSYLVLSADRFKEKEAVSDADVRSYYEKHSAEFMNPEKVKLAYIDLSVDKLADDVPAPEGDVRQYFEQNKANYSVAEERKVRQLLVPVAEKATDAQVAEAKARAEALHEQLVKGADMPGLAEKDKANAPAAVQFSEFGFMSHGVFEQSVDDVVFKLAKGEFSQPVRSKFGFEILQVTDIKGGSAPAFEDVRADVERDYKHAKAEDRYLDLADKLANRAFEHPDSLDGTAADLGLKVNESDFITRDYSGKDVLGNPKVIHAAFSEDVLQNGNNSELIEIDADHSVVLRVTEHVAANRKPVEEVRDGIVTRLKYERARDAARQQGEDIIKRLKAGTGPYAIAAEQGIKWEDARGVKQDDPDVNRTVLRLAFGAGRPAGGKPVYDGVSMGTGDYALVTVTGVHDPEPGSMDAKEMKTVHDQMQQARSNAAWATLILELRRRAKVEIFEDKLKGNAE